MWEGEKERDGDEWKIMWREGGGEIEKERMERRNKEWNEGRRNRKRLEGEGKVGGENEGRVGEEEETKGGENEMRSENLEYTGRNWEEKAARDG